MLKKVKKTRSRLDITKSTLNLEDMTFGKNLDDARVSDSVTIQSMKNEKPKRVRPSTSTKPRSQSAIGNWIQKLQLDNNEKIEGAREKLMKNLLAQDDFWYKNKQDPEKYSFDKTIF